MSERTSPRARVVRVIAAKELRETLRDRRTVLLMVLLPVVLYPGLLLLVAQVAGARQAELDALPSRVRLTSAATPADLMQRLRADPRITLQDEPPQAVQDSPEGALLADRTDVAVAIDVDPVARLAAGERIPVRLLFDAARERSALARDRAREAVRGWADGVRADRLAALAVDDAWIDPVAVESENVAPPARMGGHLLGRILPTLLVLTVLLGAFHPAIDLTAGEKERGTLQTLLTAPITPLEIVTGKFLAVCAIAFLSGLVNIGSFALLFTHGVALGGDALVDLDLSLGVGAVVLLLVAAVVLGLLFSAVTMTVAVLARSFKEAQTWLAPVYLACVVPAVLAQLPGMTLSPAAALVPAFNVTLLVRELLAGTATAEGAFLALGSSLVYTALALVVAARLFQNEAVLLGTASPLVGLFGPGRAGAPARVRGRDVASVGEAFALYGVLFVLLYYVGSLLQAADLLAGLAATLWGLLAGTTLLFVRLRGLRPGPSLGLRRPSLRATAAGALLGVSVWPLVLAIVQPLQSRFLPIPKELAQSMEGLLAAPEGALGPLWLILAVAVSPAICEELVFRGLVLGAFRRALPGRRGALLAVAGSALLFGVFHLSVYRLLGTFTLGLVAGAIALAARSIVPAMLFHAFNNAALLAAAGSLGPAWIDPADGAPAPSLVVAGGALAAVAGALLVWEVRGRSLAQGPTKSATRS